MKLTEWVLALTFISCIGMTLSGQEVTPSNASNRIKAKKQLKPIAISCSVCVRKAIYLPKPQYPGHLNVSGPVTVKVLIDELGNVISAKAMSGHPLLRAPSVYAASKAKFVPTRIGGKPVKIYTTIVYNFGR